MGTKKTSKRPTKQRLTTLPKGYADLLTDLKGRVRSAQVNAAISVSREFLLELGVGFAFVGSQYHLEVGETDFYVDLLFYHLKLRAYVVIDLKVRKFTPEYAGKMNFYLSAVDDLLRHPDDQPSIGIILCKSKDEIVAEYALRDVKKPIGVAGYQLTRMLPKDLKTDLPTIEELEAELAEPDTKK